MASAEVVSALRCRLEEIRDCILLLGSQEVMKLFIRRLESIHMIVKDDVPADQGRMDIDDDWLLSRWRFVVDLMRVKLYIYLYV